MLLCGEARGDNLTEVTTSSLSSKAKVLDIPPLRRIGGGGNDTLYGGPGADRLDGGAGDDKFWAATATTRCATTMAQRPCGWTVQ